MKRGNDLNYVAEPVSRRDIRELSLEVRKLLYIEDILYLPILPILEIVMPLLFESFQYEIVEISEMPKNKHAETDVVNKIIRIREDVYEGAVRGNGRDRMTIAHEISHYIERTYAFCFMGLPENAVVAIGTHGCIKKALDKYYFRLGFSEMIKRLSPHTIIVYGNAPKSLLSEAYNSGIKIIAFKSSFSESRKWVPA